MCMSYMDVKCLNIAGRNPKCYTLRVVVAYIVSLSQSAVSTFRGREQTEFLDGGRNKET
jgi:hypothetical protein